MITVYQLPQAFDLPVSVSPFCAKLEAYLRLTGHPYETAIGDKFKAPAGTMPYVKMPNGSMLSTSTAVVDALEQAGPGLDNALDDTARERGETLRELAEDQLYWPLLYSRFGDPAGWTHQVAAVRPIVPWLLRPVLIPVIKRSQVKRCAEHGWTEQADIYTRGVAVVDALADALGDGDWFLGDAPHSVDCAVWAPVMHASYTRSDNPLTAAVRGHDNLMAFVDRLAQRADLALPPRG